MDLKTCGKNSKKIRDFFVKTEFPYLILQKFYFENKVVSLFPDSTVLIEEYFKKIFSEKAEMFLFVMRKFSVYGKTG